MKFIYQELRSDNKKTVYQHLMAAVEMRRKYSQYVVGFDLVDQEDRYHTLLFYIHDFLQIQSYIAANNDLPLPYFFHAGETDWTNKDNLYDAVLLNTTRIGHGYALREYPVLMDLVKQKQIALEVCPISNQMLKLLVDLRNHPAVEFLNNGLPVTISSDDPIIYGYQGVTYDYYMAYMAWNLEISGLKQLTLNSLTYSALSPTEKTVAVQQWQQSWNAWIDWVLDNYGVNGRV